MTTKVSYGVSNILDPGTSTSEIVVNESGADVDFRVESSGNPGMLTVDAANDRVGIGTSTPATQLEVSDTGDNTTISVTSDIATILRTKDTAGLTDEKAWELINDAGTIVWRLVNDANTPISTVYQVFRNGALVDYQDWYTGTNNLAMRIDNAGGLRIGSPTHIFNAASNETVTIRNNTVGAAMTVSATDTTGGYPIVNWLSDDAVNTGSQICFHFVRTPGPVIVGSITTTLSSTAFNTTSDYRLKENVTALTGAIDRVKTLSPKRFNFIAEPDRTVDGFLAHEVTAVPEAIVGTKDQVDDDGKPVYQGIDQSKLVPLLTAALQEAVAKIELLETRISGLEQLINAG